MSPLPTDLKPPERCARHCVCCSATCSGKPESCRCHWYEDPIYGNKIEHEVKLVDPEKNVLECLDEEEL